MRSGKKEDARLGTPRWASSVEGGALGASAARRARPFLASLSERILHSGEAKEAALDTPPTEGPDTPLTEDEKRVLKVLASGGTREIGAQLKMSPDTVRTHVQNILAKLGVQSRLEAVAYAVKWGYLPPVWPDE